MPEMPDALVVVAMPEEAEPFLEAASVIDSPDVFGCEFAILSIGAHRVALVRSGIGLTAAASSLSAILARLTWDNPGEPLPPVISAGTAGGLAATVRVRDVAVGTSFAYADADARAFGYDLGQIPRQPRLFTAHELLTAAVRARAEEALLEVAQGTESIHYGQQLSGNSFVTAENATEIRRLFPDAIGVDMESAALAQVCHHAAIPFISIRGISDLCGPQAGQEFHVGVDIAAARSTAVTLAVVDEIS